MLFYRLRSGWCLELFRVHYRGYDYEVDYMSGLEPRQEVFNYIEELYKSWLSSRKISY